MRFSTIVLSYLIIGAVMVGGGALSLQDSGVATWFISVDDDGSLAPSGNAIAEANSIGGAIESAVSLAVGTVLLVWNLIVGLLVFLNWPITVLLSNNAPPMIVLLIGGGYSAAFYLSIIRLVKTSA